MVLVWMFPIPIFVGPLFGLTGRGDYNPDVFRCEQGWSVQSGRKVILSSIASFAFYSLKSAYLSS